MNVSIDDSRLKAALIKLKRSAQASIVGGIVRKNVVPLVRTMKELAPERAPDMFYVKSRKKVNTNPAKRLGKTYEAGNLKKSIGTRTFTGRGDLAVYVGPNKGSTYDGWYAMFQELGTKTTGFGGPISPNPFIKRSADATMPVIVNNLEKDTAEYIERLAKKNKL